MEYRCNTCNNYEIVSPYSDCGGWRRCKKTGMEITMSQQLMLLLVGCASHTSLNLAQCHTCKHEGTRACMSHGYPVSNIPNSCDYKLGIHAEEAMKNLSGTFIDCWTNEHDNKIKREGYQSFINKLRDHLKKRSESLEKNYPRGHDQRDGAQTRIAEINQMLLTLDAMESL